MRLVLDCSVTLSWYFEDEESDISEAVFDRVAEVGALVPALWRYEVANGLQAAVRRRRITTAYRDESLIDLGALDVMVDLDGERHVWATSIAVAERHGLTVYDATYLELAMRSRLELATLDRQLIRAAVAEGIPTIGV